MGWFSGKKTVPKFNPLQISRTQQEQFLKNYVGLSSNQLSKLKKMAKTEGLFSASRPVSKRKFLQVLKKYTPQATGKFKEYEQQMQKQYQEWQEQIKKEKIKKTIKLERKRERAEEMIDKLTGQISRRDLLKKRTDPVGGSKGSIYNLARENKKLLSQGFSKEEIAVMRARERFVNPSRTDWHNAEQGKFTTISDSKGKQSSSPSSKPKDIDQIKEEAKNLPELQI